ncbi:MULTISPECIES: TonB-dependent receptor domain-containing protein [unclassified Sphingomonas]|uniref:TonB-dependent receptor n=1 Tax=Novosphingobium rhizosphaerae TaxID=1551649 RepID=UPI0015CD1E0C
MTKYLLWSAAACALASSPSLAQAQDAGAATTPEAPQTGIGDIVVTAQRRSENLQRVAVAVSAVNAASLVNAGVSQPQDLSKLVPALKLAASGGAGTQVTVRGVGNFAGNAYAEPAVAVNLDGVYIARSAGADGLFYDLDRVEVLKGPQGTLYGRNATAGALNIIAHKPDDAYEASGNVTVGNYNLWRGELALNAPLGGGSAFRVAGQITRRDGYFSDGYNDDRSEAVRAQLKLVASDRFHVLIASDYAHQGGKGPGAVFSPFLSSNAYAGPTADGSNALLRNVSLGITGGQNPNLLPAFTDKGYVNANNVGVSATAEYAFNNATLTVIPAYRDSSNDYLQYNPGFPLQVSENAKTTSLEARLASSNKTARLQWLLGGFFYNEDLHFNLFANQGVSFSYTNPLLNTRSYAAFGQLTFALADGLRLTGGLRYTHEHKTQAGNHGSPLGAGQSTSTCAPYDATTGACYAALSGDLTANRVTWKGGVEYDAGPQSLLYANVGTGFKAGGFFGSQPPNTYKPETLTAYTIGSKNRFFGNTLQVNAELFYWDYRNKQVTHLGPIQPAGFDLITENAGKAEIYGSEVEITWQPAPSDTLSADVQYLHSRYKEFTYTQSTANGPAQTSCPTTAIAGQAAVQVNCAGRTVPLSPTWTVNLSYRHTFDLAGGSRIDAQVGTRIESGYWLGEEYVSGQYQDATTVSNATLTWHAAGDRFSVSGFVDNIEDRVIKSMSFVHPVLGLPVVGLRPPRTFGARLGFNF